MTEISFGPNPDSAYHIKLKGGMADGYMTDFARMEDPPWPKMWVRVRTSGNEDTGPEISGLIGWPQAMPNTELYVFERVGWEPDKYRENLKRETAFYTKADMDLDAGLETDESVGVGRRELQPA